MEDPHDVTILTDPAGAEIIWQGHSLGQSGQKLVWDRRQFQETPGVDRRIQVVLRKDGYADAPVWLDADLWRYHRWPPRAETIVLLPSRWDTRAVSQARSWGVPLLLTLLLMVAWVARERRRWTEQNRVVTAHLPGLLGEAVFSAGESRTLDLTVVFLQKTAEARLSKHYFERATTVITGHGGHVVRTVGEQILAVFPGDPTGVRQALLSALEVKSSLDLAGLPSHCGIHTGPILSTCLGEGQRRQWTLVGDDINLAARLLSMARKWGTPVVVSDRVRELCGETEMQFSPRGTHSVKGRQNQVTVWEPHPSS